jgi:hypothetical protein
MASSLLIRKQVNAHHPLLYPAQKGKVDKGGAASAIGP